MVSEQILTLPELGTSSNAEAPPTLVSQVELGKVPTRTPMKRPAAADSDLEDYATRTPMKRPAAADTDVEDYDETDMLTRFVIDIQSKIPPSAFIT